MLRSESLSLESEGTSEDAEPHRGLASLAVLALFLGAVVGLVGAAFRLALDRADAFRDAILANAGEQGFAGLLFVIVLTAAATALAAWLLSPGAESEGSGALGTARDTVVRCGRVDSVPADADARHPFLRDEG
jgi:hypothetical protein